jgi:radical SAM protein with 4Fe4S-binding SPASM domain
MKIIFRAEPGYLMAYNLTTKKSLRITGDNLNLLNQWLDTGAGNDFIQRLNTTGFLSGDMGDQEKTELKQLAARCRKIEAPLRSMHTPEIMNIELTTRCPLRCPQCYCDLNRGQDIKKEIAFKYIDQAADLKIPFINLSGGETLIYPYLTELLERISSRGLSSAISISGWGFDPARLLKLKRAGVDEIYVSLNGSTREINELSRDGYEMAVNALNLLKADRQVNYYINWVARNDNAEDFPQLVSLAEELGVKGIVILESKPDAGYALQSTLSPEHFLGLADYLKKHEQQKISIQVEPCFSPLRAYINNYYLWNRNTGVNKGCGAGRNAMAVDVEGNLIPCRHLLYSESFESIEDYWWKSKVLNKLRQFEDYREEPCRSCYLKNNCISCRAVADKVEKNLFSGNHYCSAREMAK